LIKLNFGREKYTTLARVVRGGVGDYGHTAVFAAAWRRLPFFVLLQLVNSVISGALCSISI